MLINKVFLSLKLRFKPSFPLQGKPIREKQVNNQKLFTRLVFFII